MPSFPAKDKLITKRKVLTPKGLLTATKEETVTMKTKKKVIRTNTPVYENLSCNFLSVFPMIEKLGALLLDNQWPDLISSRLYERLKPTLHYFGKRFNKLYHIPVLDVELCLKAEAESPVDSISNTSPLLPRIGRKNTFTDNSNAEGGANSGTYSDNTGHRPTSRQTYISPSRTIPTRRHEIG